MVRGLVLLTGWLAMFPLLACQGKPQPTKPMTNAEIEGQWLYDNNCAACHESPQPDLHKEPPDLHGLFLRKSLPSGAQLNDAELRKVIIEGRGTMPAFDRRFRDEEINDLIQYLHRLR